ncbi:DNA ligase/mRNA capping enzyme [Wallemia mellicola]|nr:DNA ligase/mRNA capping enzyme [Wallemia mellicola]TIC50226.1 DNA ligase/mRNA capping enzyme [Wallemia mellicola]
MASDGLFDELAELLYTRHCTITAAHSPHKPPNPNSGLLRWLTNIREKCVFGTGKIIFRLIFPEMDMKRRYGVKEHTLVPLLSSILGVDIPLTSHCLGIAAYNALSKVPSSSKRTCLSLHRIDELLNELAAKCIWSSDCVKVNKSRRTKDDILRDLFSGLTPESVAFTVQVILKDITPLLFPSPAKSLMDCNSNSYIKLTLHDTMAAWHWYMPKIYSKMADLDLSADAIDELPLDATPFQCIQLIQSRPGVQLEIPSCIKGQSLRHALDVNQGCEQLIAETKYDGERVQIHIIDQDIIKIFSKSKVDSTSDRAGIVPIIRKALGLPSKSYPPGFPDGEFNDSLTSSEPTRGITSGIFEAEMVAFDRRKNKIDEYYRIRELLQSCKGNNKLSNFEAMNSNSSLESVDENLNDCSKRHLAVVFFDILHLDGRDLTDEPLSNRREILEEVSMLSQVDKIDIRNSNKAMHRIYASNIANCQEGLVLKPSYGTYNCSRLRWVKIKRDYIPGLGDTADFVIIGARHDPQRGLLPHVLTTFTVALKAKQTDMRKLRKRSGINQWDVRDHYHALFEVSYGLVRSELEDLNLEAKCRAGESPSLPYTYSFERGLQIPTILFQRPILFELTGASFTRKPRSKWYELRFPRITKVYNDKSKAWDSGLTLRDLQSLALNSIDTDRQDAEDEIKGVFEGYTINRCDKWLTVLKQSENSHSWKKCKTWLDPAIKIFGEDKEFSSNSLMLESDVSSSDDKLLAGVISRYRHQTPATSPKTISQVLGKRGRENYDDRTEDEESCASEQFKSTQELDEQTEEEPIHVADLTETPQTPNRRPYISTPLTPQKRGKAVPPLDRCLIFADSHNATRGLDRSAISLGNGLDRLFDYVGWYMRPQDCDFAGRIALVVLSTTRLGVVAALKSRKNYIDREFIGVSLGRVVTLVVDAQSDQPISGYRQIWDSLDM